MDSKVQYQTLSQFLREPFGSPDFENQRKLMEKYRKNTTKISVASAFEYEKTFLIHVKIPSESKAGEFYDVVIQFIPGNKEVEKELTLRNYFVQFFSNSPSFIYRYAVLYKNKGYMIDALQEKMDPNYANALPTKTNAGMKLTYDKSLFFACMYLEEHQKRYLTKLFLAKMPKINFRRFLDGITSYQGEKFQYDIYEIEAKLKDELIHDIQTAGRQMTLMPKPKDRSGSPGILDKRKPVAKISPKLHTFSSSSLKGMTLRPAKKAKKTGLVRRKPKVRSTTKK